MKMSLQNIRLLSAIVSVTIGSLMIQLFAAGLYAQQAWAAPIAAEWSDASYTTPPDRGSPSGRGGGAGRYVPPPPPGRSTPGSRGGGAGRSCGVGNQTITALVPEYQQMLPEGGSITKVWGTTIAEHPTFWFDVPYEKGAIVSLEFILQDNSHPAKDLYRTTVTPPDTPGVISIHLPETVSPLETDKLYQWFLKARLQCTSSQPNVKASVMQNQVYGWIQRISSSADLAVQLNQASPQEKVNLYIQNGIWFDAITTLGDLRLVNSSDTDLAKTWNSLLQAVNLEKVATKPIVPCCQPSFAQSAPLSPSSPGSRRGEGGR